jgi:putative ABC transport system permease protein
MIRDGGRATHQRAAFSYPELEDVWRDAGDIFDGLAMAYTTTFTVRPEEGEAERTPGAFATANLFSNVLRVPALVGRTFSREDEIAGDPVVVISEPYWRLRFNSDPDIIGRPLRIAQTTTTIIGVLPGAPTLGGPEAQIWYLMRPWTNRGDHRTNAIARLQPGVTPEQAEARVRNIIEGEHEHEVVVSSRKEDLVANVRQPLWILGAASLLLLFIATANVGALHLGRLIDREGEIAVRRALGAGRRQLVVQLAAEGLVLSVVTAAVAILLIQYGFSVLSLLVPPGLPRMSELAVDARILGMGIGATILLGVLTALAPLVAFRGTSAPALIGSARGSVKGRANLQGAVIVGQIALATILLYGTGLLTRTVNELGSTNPGFAIHELASFSLSYPPSAPADSTSPAVTSDRALQAAAAIRAIPGVQGVAIADLVPLGVGRGNNSVNPEGYTGEEIVAERRFVSGGYFDVTGIRLVEGRGISDADDRPDGPDVVVISQSLAQRAWPGESAVGKRLAFWGRDPSTVVGVAEDLRDMQMRTPTSFAFYVARQRLGQSGGNILVRSDNPAAMSQTVSRRLQEEFPGVAFIDAGPMARHMETAIAGERFRARLTWAFALCAVVFCALGVYGVIARTVSSRQREFGIRMALGANGSMVLRRIVANGLRLAALGGALGILFAFWGAQFLRTQLFGVGEVDVVTLVGVAALLVAIAVASAIGPALRAARIHPSDALRSE